MSKIGNVGFDRIGFTINMAAAGVNVDAAIEESAELKTRSIDIVNSDNFKDIRYRLYNKREMKKDTLKLDIVAGRILHNTIHNVYVCPADAIASVVNTVLEELKAAGIIIPFAALEVTSLEINKTIPTDMKLDDFKDEIKYCFGNKCGSNNSDKNDSCTLVFNNSKNRKTLKFYDKSAQTLNTFNIPCESNLVRFEISFNNRDSINRTFKTFDILKITQNIIDELFEKEVKEVEDNLIKAIKIDAASLYYYFESEKAGKKFKDINNCFQLFDRNRMTASKQNVLFYEIPLIAFKNYYKKIDKFNAVRDTKKAVGIGECRVYTNLENVLKMFSKMLWTEFPTTQKKHVKSQLYQLRNTILD